MMGGCCEKTPKTKAWEGVPEGRVTWVSERRGSKAGAESERACGQEVIKETRRWLRDAILGRKCRAAQSAGHAREAGKTTKNVSLTDIKTNKAEDVTLLQGCQEARGEGNEPHVYHSTAEIEKLASCVKTAYLPAAHVSCPTWISGFVPTDGAALIKCYLSK